MKGFVIVSKGIEEIASIEIKELINAECIIEEGCVIFEFKNFEDLCLLCYKCQSVDRILYLIGSFGFSDFFDDFRSFIEKLDFGKWIEKYKKFKVECIRQGKHDFKSVDIEAKASEFILKKLKNNKINLKDYEIIFLIYVINNKCYFGVDFAGFELNKRDYKIFLHPSSLRGTIAYALIRESSFEKEDVMLDPFSRDCVIAIEAAFYASGFPHNYYKKDRFAFLKLDLGIDFEKFFKETDKKIKSAKIKDSENQRVVSESELNASLRAFSQASRAHSHSTDFPVKPKAEIYSYDHLFKYVDYSKKNAKIAGVDKFINFSRVELEWLDIKFKEKSVNRIITNPPTSKNANLDKVYNEFFYQSEYILKDDGTITLISKIPDFVKKHAEKHNFIVSKEKDVWSGEQLLKIIHLKRKIYKQ